MTNGDWVRRLTNEELALFLAEDRAKLARSIFEMLGFGIETQVVYLSLLRWVNQPVEENAGS